MGIDTTFGVGVPEHDAVASWAVFGMSKKGRE
jgi:hypothetical protein